MEVSKKDKFNPIWMILVFVIFIIGFYYKTFTDSNKEWQMDNEGSLNIVDNTIPLSINKICLVVIPILLIIYFVRGKIKKK